MLLKEKKEKRKKRVRDLNKKIAQANKVKIDALKQQKALSDKKLEKTTKEKNLANKKIEVLKEREKVWQKDLNKKKASRSSNKTANVTTTVKIVGKNKSTVQKKNKTTKFVEIASNNNQGFFHEFTRKNIRSIQFSSNKSSCR